MRKERSVSDSPLIAAPVFRRRVARDAFCDNAFLWGVGNSFVGSTFVIYFLKSLAPNANDSAALGTAIAWTVAAPRFVGLLRLLTPVAIGWIGGRQRLCVVCSLLAPAILLATPFGAPFFELLAARPNGVNVAFFLIGAIWALYHLVEYVATTALWSWMGDVVTPATRLRFFARRERRLLLGKLVGLAGVGVFTYLQASSTLPTDIVGADAWRIALPLLGVAFLTASAFPLLFAPEICADPLRNASAYNSLRQLSAPLFSPSFLSLVLFGAALQAILGFTQSPQYYFRTTVLQLSLFASLATSAVTNVGQWSTSGLAARLVARLTVPNACFWALGFVALGFLAYASAAPSDWLLAFEAAGFWIAWIVVNIALNNEITRRSDPDKRSAYVAFYFAATALAFALGSMLGGCFFDGVRAAASQLGNPNLELLYCRRVFLVGAALLALAPSLLLLSRAFNLRDNNV